MTKETSVPTADEQRNEASAAEPSNAAASTSRDTTTPQAAEEMAVPPLPQRPTEAAHHQPLPQPFYSQNHQVPYVPYPAPPNQQYLYAAHVRPLPKQSSAWIATKLGLTALSSVWDIIIIALTSILLSEDGTVSFTSLYAYAIVVASILWNTAELITYCVRVRKGAQRGIHPGAHVGLHLIFWLVGAFAIFLTVGIYASAVRVVWRCENDNDIDDYYPYYRSYCDDLQPLDYFKQHVLPVLRALIAIFALWLINHFVLFVFACIDTQKRNMLRPAAVVASMGGPAADPAQGIYYPQQAAMAPVTMQHYPYPVMMQPQPTYPAAGAELRGPVLNEKQLAQDITGFYGPASGPAARPNQIQPQQQLSPAQAVSTNATSSA